MMKVGSDGDDGDDEVMVGKNKAQTLPFYDNPHNPPFLFSMFHYYCISFAAVSTFQ